METLGEINFKAFIESLGEEDLRKLETLIRQNKNVVSIDIFLSSELKEMEKRLYEINQPVWDPGNPS